MFSGDFIIGCRQKNFPVRTSKSDITNADICATIGTLLHASDCTSVIIPRRGLSRSPAPHEEDDTNH